MIESIPSEAWVALATAIVASAITLIGVWLTNRSNNQRLKMQLEHENAEKNEALRRERLEELYIVSNKFFNKLVMHYMPFRAVMEGELTFNQALDITIESGTQTDFDPQRVNMLIALYFPEIKPQFNEILALREKLNDLVDGFKAQYKDGNPDGTKWLVPFQPLLEQIAQKTDKFEKHVTKINIKNE